MKRLLGILLAAALLCGCAFAQGASSAIIGGADGPTMIFVAPTSEIVDIVGEVESASVEGGEAAAEPSPEPTQKPRLAGVKIGIDPGHQEHANSDTEPIAPGSSEMKQKVLSGTAGVRTRIPEYKTNLEVSLKLRDALEELGAEVFMTRETNEVDISNMERALMFNDWGVDLALRIHCNGASSSSANGAGTYARKTGEKQAESELAAGLILDALCEATGARRDGVFLRDTYTGQNWATVPCVMVEMGYMSNPEEDEKLNDPAYQQLLAQGIAEGVCRYIETVNGTGGYWTIQQGSRGEPVEILQAKLIELGYLDGAADGIYGAKTAEAVRACQEAMGLEPTGVADAEFQRALLGGEEDAEAGAEQPAEAEHPVEAIAEESAEAE